MLVFFFKQKTAYEMRISDWSSDVCSSDLVSTAVATLRMGAVTLIEKPLDLKLLIAAVDDAFEALRNRTVGEIIRSDAAEQLNRLSPRELQVLRAITDGQQNKMIALQLGISPRTVEVYRANIMRSEEQ